MVTRTIQVIIYGSSVLLEFTVCSTRYIFQAVGKVRLKYVMYLSSEDLLLRNMHCFDWIIKGG